MEDYMEQDIEEEDVLLQEPDSKISEEEIVNIDYNNRIMTNSAFGNNSSSELCDSENNYSAFQTQNDESMGDTSCEEMEVSDEEASSASSVLTLQKVHLDEIACVGSKKRGVLSHYSSTEYTEENLTDSELFAEGFDGNDALCKKGGEKKVSLTGGLTIGSTAAKDAATSASQSSTNTCVSSFFGSLSLKGEPLPKKSGKQMTCLEFLSAELSDGDATDIEDFATDCISVDDQIDGNSVISENVLKQRCHRGKGGIFSNDQISRGVNGTRRPSWTVEYLSDEETPSLYDSKSRKYPSNNRSKKRLSNTDEDANDCLTDEETFALNGESQEWTETDGSGSVRQVTHIKTETSIKLEGGGESLGLDPDLVSSTTTTRVVTSVVTDSDDPSQIESSTIIQQLYGDGGFSQHGESGHDE